MLISYQEAVSSLLGQNEFPGVTAEELEMFKSQFRNSAFTCRLHFCPRATLGFGSEKLRLDHEMSHMRRFRCTFPGCQYPPFGSYQSLKNHLNKYHNPSPPRKLIRKVARIQTAKSINTEAITTYERSISAIRKPASLPAFQRRLDAMQLNAMQLKLFQEKGNGATSKSSLPMTAWATLRYYSSYTNRHSNQALACRKHKFSGYSPSRRGSEFTRSPPR